MDFFCVCTSYHDSYLIFMHVGMKWYLSILQFSLSDQDTVEPRDKDLYIFFLLFSFFPLNCVFLTK